MDIAMLGSRGVPASYSGVETCVEELGRRLVERGHRVTVYCRSHHITYPHATYRGMTLVKLPTIANKYLDTIVHTTLSALHLSARHADVALFFIAGNSPVCWLPRLTGKRVAINVDGLDWRREKWPPLAKRYIQLAERLAPVAANVVITDALEVQRYYRQAYGVDTVYIPYGADAPLQPPGETLRRYGLTPRGYLLFVGRLVPENCVHHLIDAVAALPTDLKCVIVGDSVYAKDYKAELRRRAGPNVVFTGYLFGDGYRELASNAYAVVATHSAGGTHPAILEAMAFGNCVVVNDTPENLETVGPGGLSYPGAGGGAALRARLAELLADPGRVEADRARARRWVEQTYSWDRVTDAYEALFRTLVAGEPVVALGGER